MKDEGSKELIEEIILFADKAHGEQKRKYTSDPYIVHPIRVMQICQVYTNDIAVLAAALLHDVLEDTHVSEEEIRTFLDTILTPAQTIKTLKLVNELTDIYIKKNYPALNRRARKEKEAERLANCSDEAQSIKCADIIDNALNIIEHDHDFGAVYLREAKALLQKINKADKRLYDRAVNTVEECLNILEKTTSVNNN